MNSIDKVYARAFFLALNFDKHFDWSIGGRTIPRLRNRNDAARFAERAVAWFYRHGGVC